MTKDEHGYQPGRHDQGRTITERLRAWLVSAPLLLLATCAGCSTTQVLSRQLAAEAERVLRCPHCGTDIATVTRRDRETWIEPIDASAAAFPTSPFRITRAAAAGHAG